MDGYGGDQIRAAERPHLDAGEPLMQRAAAGLAEHVGLLLDDPAERPGDGRGSVLLLVGSGDNGGDALFAGAGLASDGRHVEILRVGSRIHEAGLRAALDAGAVLLSDGGDQAATASDAALRADLVLDAILGIGVHGASALRSPAREVVQAIRELARDQRAPFVVAVDVPSGIDVDTGAIADDHVLQADVTVTFGGVKAGLLTGPGATLAGRIELVDVGIGADLARSEPLIRT
ncbi:yjeF N-terminal region [Curtobacterium sp. 9128]|uniref:NAD(P)H-hydrate epimerase n=1 Tax=Curtobacterium sp. 9128 TaxID=1793722 RepID=UPI0007D7253F|nr:NAD(P)H-hydrate epimerase [Curtobacterium sp. 9128]SBN61196.1 yjeF N-terminal region [Curtobacterium sp. 9128]